MIVHSPCLLWELCGHGLHTDSRTDTSRHFLRFLAGLLLLDCSRRYTGNEDGIAWVFNFLWTAFQLLESRKNSGVKMDVSLVNTCITKYQQNKAR